MKSNFEIARRLIVRAVTCLGLALGLIAFAPPAQAQVQPPKAYPLVNLSTFNPTNSATQVITSSNVLSQPFTLVRDRGYTTHAAFYSTNGVSGSVSFVFDFATPIKVGTAQVTNWLSAPLVTNTFTLNGSNEVFAAAVNASSTIQNVTLGRLKFITVTTNSPIYFDATNNFAAITP